MDEDLKRFVHGLTTRRGLLAGALAAGLRLEGASRRTVIEISRGTWRLNGATTYPGTPAEGLLLNVRMVNAIFEDANAATRPGGFDAEENTRRFLQAALEYIEAGIRAFTISLQGGDPGYEGAVNSAINADGTVRPAYMRRAGRVIETCDRVGAAVMLSCFYQRQDQLLRDETAIRTAVVNVAR